MHLQCETAKFLAFVVTKHWLYEELALQCRWTQLNCNIIIKSTFSFLLSRCTIFYMWFILVFSTWMPFLVQNFPFIRALDRQFWSVDDCCTPCVTAAPWITNTEWWRIIITPSQHSTAIEANFLSSLVMKYCTKTPVIPGSKLHLYEMLGKYTQTWIKTKCKYMEINRQRVICHFWYMLV